MVLFASSNPFVTSYIQADWFGKLIYFGLFALSAVCWILIIYKCWLYSQVKRLSKTFHSQFSEKDLLNLQFAPSKGRLMEVPNPFFEIYKSLKQKTLQIIDRNHYFAPNEQTVLSEADLGLIESEIQITMATQNKLLEKNLFILSTIVTLGPFMGLLGTVWGILTTFSGLHSRGISISNAAMLTGLSLALTTTVIGLVIAIPAIIGYNYLKNAARDYRGEMENFSQTLLSTTELQYRKPDHEEKISIHT